ncbi:MAG: ATP-binding cassette domain-containing protein [Patescibacteria group bacterium]|jgi:cell division transport system ATP-binding protein
MAQIEFKNVTKEYEDFIALKEVTIFIEKGEFVFIVGPSGAGKSTLIKMLIRDEQPTSGEVVFEDKNVLDIPREDLCNLRRRIGVVFQDFKLLDSKTVFENVAVATEVVDCPKEEIDAVVPNVLNMVGLLDKRDKYPVQLSGGEKQRLSIARALAHEPDVLIADEPTGMIDPVASDEVMIVLERINEMGTTVVMATHDEVVVNKMKKRVIRMKNGSIVSDKKKGKYDEQSDE